MTPRETYSFVGHEAAEAELAEALADGRMHHAWLIVGPEGVGKATLAFRAARAALGARVVGPRPLDVSPEDIVARRIAQGAHPDFFLLERGLNEKGKRQREIPVAAARELPAFFTLQAAEGGMRVAIIDALDDLNNHGANALLKILEEPPPRALIMLICHAPGAALPTLRSRCRRLALRPLSTDDVARVVDADKETLRLAAGRPGRALALKREGTLAYEISAALACLERQGVRALLPLATAQGGDKSERFALVTEALTDWLRRQAGRTDATLSRAAAWANAYADLQALRVEAQDLDLDPSLALARAVAIVGRGVGQ
jgi:DNA polymerase-3 subunit delta'